MLFAIRRGRILYGIKLYSAYSVLIPKYSKYFEEMFASEAVIFSRKYSKAMSLV